MQPSIGEAALQPPAAAEAQEPGRSIGVARDSTHVVRTTTPENVSGTVQTSIQVLL